MITLILMAAVLGQSPAATPKPVQMGIERMDGFEKSILLRYAMQEAERHKDDSNAARRTAVVDRLKKEFHYFPWFKLPFSPQEEAWISGQAERAAKPFDHAEPAGVISTGREWHFARMPDGSTRSVYGWKNADGTIGWYAHEQPQPQYRTVLIPMRTVQQCTSGMCPR